MSISIHGPSAVSGSYNVFGLADGAFILQGNLTLEQIKELRDECNAVLKSVKGK
jgi:hypothetical protein